MKKPSAQEVYDDGLTPYQRARRKKYRDQAMRPWYWPYESTIRNLIMYALISAVVFCFGSEKLITFKAWRRKRSRIELARKSEARKSQRKVNDEPEVACAAD